MTKTAGKLIVFEGPDGVGKSTLVSALSTRLTESGDRVTQASFPGKLPGSLGRHVYEIHHNPSQFGIDRMTPASLQLLHVAAHLDAIETQIRPRVIRGETVVLDRYWWSTWVYGVTAGAPESLMDKMVELERGSWSLSPSIVFLIARESPLRETDKGAGWSQRVQLYERLAGKEEHFYPVRRVRNDRSVEEALSEVVTILAMTPSQERPRA